MAARKSGPTSQCARHWLITQHDVRAFWRSSPTDHVAFKYLVFQVEEGEETKSWHIQGFIQFTEQVRGCTVQRLFGGKKCHIEVAYHPSKARDYCMKEDTRVTPPEEYGKWEPAYTRGYRSDLTIGKYEIRSHGNYRDCLDDDRLDMITAKYPRWVTEQLSRVVRPIKKKTVTVFYGPTGTGKTYRCHTLNPGILDCRMDNGFFNYSGQEKVLFDEFDKDPLPFGTFLKLLDAYPFQVNIKNGYAWWEPSEIYITATDPPSEWFIGKSGYRIDMLPQLMRRLTNVINTAEEIYVEPDEETVIMDPEEIQEEMFQGMDLDA